MLSAKVFNGDTLPFRYLDPVYKLASRPSWARLKINRSDPAYRILRYNVMRAYPYAIQATYALREIDSAMNTLYSKEAKRNYKEKKEMELNARFNKELTDLTIDQGKILVKLISRYTGQSAYDIIKSMKGGVNARIYQGMARIWDNNLKATYDPTGEDAMMEAIVRELEWKYYKDK